MQRRPDGRPTRAPRAAPARAGLHLREVSSGHSAIFDGDRQVPGSQCPREVAERSLERVQRRRASRVRPCLCCGSPFVSEGAHNRLCGGCRLRSEGLAGA
jgi:hypothetical protein